MNGQVTPQFVQAILEWQWTWPIARFALVVYYLVSGLSKIANFRGAIAEMAQAGMPAPSAMALLTIIVELTGSVLVLTDRWVWLGAGMLRGLHRHRRRHRPRLLEGVGPGADRGDRCLPHAHWADRRFRALRPRHRTGRARRARGRVQRDSAASSSSRWAMKPARDRPFWDEVEVVLIIGQARTASAILRRSS
jgi:DoxX